MITQQDIVEHMIRVAAGDKLSVTQEQIGIHGHAIECRIYAEDPFRNFLPAIGEPTSVECFPVIEVRTLDSLSRANIREQCWNCSGRCWCVRWNRDQHVL